MTDERITRSYSVADCGHYHLGGDHKREVMPERRPMTERITTEAGRRLLALLASQRVSQDDSWKNGCLYAEECFRNSLAAIEAEAVAAERARMRERVEGLPTKPNGYWVEEMSETVSRAAVLAILEEVK